METDELATSLRRIGLAKERESIKAHPLQGGVSSDIILVEVEGRRFCVKRALARLKVAALWEAPVSRNAAEAAWMRTVAHWLPSAVPEVLAEDPGVGLFAMEHLPPETFPVWKAQLLDNRVDLEFAAAVGRVLVHIHARSAIAPDLRRTFAHDDTFEAIRIEPYLRATARAHPALAPRLTALAERTLASRRALVHGDVSPKNILVGPNGPVFLDAECAWFGDPAFDLAFCLNHLLLKGARKGSDRGSFLSAFAALGDAYSSSVDWEDPRENEARAASLLPALFLARVDGKSPVEYLTDERERDAVRGCAAPLIADPPARLAEVADAWRRAA